MSYFRSFAGRHSRNYDSDDYREYHNEPDFGRRAFKRARVDTDKRMNCLHLRRYIADDEDRRFGHDNTRVVTTVDHGEWFSSGRPAITRVGGTGDYNCRLEKICSVGKVRRVEKQRSDWYVTSGGTDMEHEHCPHYDNARSAEQTWKKYGVWRRMSIEQARIMKDGRGTGMWDEELGIAIMREIIHSTRTIQDELRCHWKSWDDIPLASGKLGKRNEIPSFIAEREFLSMDLRGAPDAEVAARVSYVETDLFQCLEGEQGISPSVTVKNVWRIPAEARCLLPNHVVRNINGVIARARIVFGTPPCLLDKIRVARAPVLENKELKSQFTERTYTSSEEFKKNLLALVDKLEEAGPNDQRIQKSCGMLVHNALIAQDWT